MKHRTLLLIISGLMFAFAPCSEFAQTKKSSTKGAVKKRTAARRASARLVGGDPFVEPKVIQSKGGILETTLQLRLTKSRVAGREIETGTYGVIENGIYQGGTIPGPTLRVKPGDTLRISLINSLTMPGGGPPPPTKFVDCGDQP